MKKYTQAFIIDSLSRDSFHEVINQCYLMMISDLYDNVTYYGLKSSIENLKLILNKCDVQLKNVRFVELKIRKIKFKPNSLNYLVDAFRIGWKNYLCLRFVKDNSDVFYNNFLHFTPLFNHLLCKKHINFIFLCHGEMEFIEKTKGKGVFAHLFSLYLKFLFCHLNIKKNYRFILLSEKMADYLRERIKEKNRDKIYGMDHCYLRPSQSQTSNLIQFQGIKLGLIGAISPSRGLSSLKEFLSKLDNPFINIYAISTISEHIESRNLIYINNSNKRLPYNEYNNYTNEMDGYLFFYNIDSYKYTASGALLDSIWNEKPVFALKNHYFEYMFNKYGNMGFLANSIDELVDYICSINKSDLLKYKKQFLFVKEKLTPDYVKLKLIEILQTLD